MPAKTPLDAISVPCGAGVDLLLEQAAQGRGADRDAHQQRCVHCQAALGEFTAFGRRSLSWRQPLYPYRPAWLRR